MPPPKQPKKLPPGQRSLLSFLDLETSTTSATSSQSKHPTVSKDKAAENDDDDDGVSNNEDSASPGVFRWKSTCNFTKIHQKRKKKVAASTAGKRAKVSDSTVVLPIR